MSKEDHRIFRIAWVGVNLLFAISIVMLLYSAAWEYSVRDYLKGFSDAIISANATPEQKVEAILNWMRSGPPRAIATDLDKLDTRGPEVTLNYDQLLSVCGTATNAFLNLSRSAGLKTRRLLLLSPERITTHVVAEVFMGGRWIVVDPGYRMVLHDASGGTLTRSELKNPVIFEQATANIPNYRTEYNYQHIAHVRLSRLKYGGPQLRTVFGAVFPGWEEKLDWSLLLERQSFLYFVVSTLFALLFLALHMALGWYADHRLKILRFRLRKRSLRAVATFFSPLETN